MVDNASPSKWVPCKLNYCKFITITGFMFTALLANLLTVAVVYSYKAKILTVKLELCQSLNPLYYVHAHSPL